MDDGTDGWMDGWTGNVMKKVWWKNPSTWCFMSGTVSILPSHMVTYLQNTRLISPTHFYEFSPRQFHFFLHWEQYKGRRGTVGVLQSIPELVTTPLSLCVVSVFHYHKDLLKLAGLACLGKDIMFRFIIEYSSLRDFFYRPLGNK
jgi:hypothetical protein